jgi:hypothetical protein
MVLRGRNDRSTRFVAVLSVTKRPNARLSEQTHKDRSVPSSQRPVVVARVLGALALLAVSLPALAAPCAAPPVGHAVFLKSADLDPDVFVWDAKQRVVDYAAGSWRDSHEVVAHTMLAKPGTRAVIVQCFAGLVRKEGTDTRDAIGVRLTNGPNKGRYGWVTSDDVHEIAKR